jgi:hypothetical protein
MNTKENRKMVSDAWRIAAKALSIDIEAPYLIRTSDGKKVSCIAHLPDFGGPTGMVIGLWSGSAHKTHEPLILAARSLELYCSLINAEIYNSYDEETFKEALTDWGFFGNEDHRPNWLPKPAKNE